MDKRLRLISFRLILGFSTLLALFVQAMVVYQQYVFDPFNYFGYFTNLSNLVAALIIIVSALYVAKSRKPSPRDDIIRGAAVLYMLVTGVIYITLLTGEDLGLLQPWVNFLLHIVMPVVVMTDWLYQPAYSTIRVRQAALWLVFPSLYLLYTLIRGAITSWYPYPFLNPAEVGGYSGVALYCLGILLAFIILGYFVMVLGNTRKRNIN